MHEHESWTLSQLFTAFQTLFGLRRSVPAHSAPGTSTGGLHHACMMVMGWGVWGVSPSWVWGRAPAGCGAEQLTTAFYVGRVFGSFSGARGGARSQLYSALGSRLGPSSQPLFMWAAFLDLFPAAPGETLGQLQNIARSQLYSALGSRLGPSSQPLLFMANAASGTFGGLGERQARKGHICIGWDLVIGFPPCPSTWTMLATIA